MTTLERCSLAACILVLAACVLFMGIMYERQERMAVAAGCGVYSLKDAEFHWVDRGPMVSVPSIPVEALGRQVKP